MACERNVTTASIAVVSDNIILSLDLAVLLSCVPLQYIFSGLSSPGNSYFFLPSVAMELNNYALWEIYRSSCFPSLCWTRIYIWGGIYAESLTAADFWCKCRRFPNPPNKFHNYMLYIKTAPIQKMFCLRWTLQIHFKFWVLPATLASLLAELACAPSSDVIKVIIAIASQSKKSGFVLTLQITKHGQ